MKRKLIYTGVAIGAIGCCAMLGVGIHSALGTNVAAQTDRDDAIEITATQTATVPTATCISTTKRATSATAKATTTARQTTRKTTAATTQTTTETTTAETEASTIEADFTPTQNPDIPNLAVNTISVSCLKLTWDGEEGRNYKIDVSTYAPYTENITFLEKANDTWYLTGLRENSEYEISVTPLLNDGETENDVCVTPATILGKTEQVNVIQTYQTEEGWTNCFTGERASGLTAMPSSGAIAGSVKDPITDTTIRRNEYGDYCVAMGLWYGVVGDRFLIELENGTQFTVSICDSKGWASDADGDGILDGRFHWFGGTGNGKSVVEFIYNSDKELPSCVAYSGSWGYYNWNGLDLGANISSVKKIDYGNTITY